MVMEFKLLGELISSTALMWHEPRLRRPRAEWRQGGSYVLREALHWTDSANTLECSERQRETCEWSNRDSCQSELLVTECPCQEIIVKKVLRVWSGREASWVRVSGGSLPARISSRQLMRGWGSTMWGHWGRLRTPTCSTASTAHPWRTRSSHVAPLSSLWASIPQGRRLLSGDS